MTRVCSSSFQVRSFVHLPTAPRPGQVRQSWRLSGDNDGGLKRLNPYRLEEMQRSAKHMGVSENSVPLNPMVNDHYPY